MENLIELFKKLEELSKSFEIFKWFKGVLPDKAFGHRNFDFFNSYKTGTPDNLLSILPLVKNAEFYMNRIQKMYFEFGHEKIYQEIKEIPFFKSNLFNESNFASYFNIFNNFSSYNLKMEDIEKSFSKGFLEINNSDSKSSFFDFSNSSVIKNEKHERYEFNLEEDFDRFGEKLADALKASIKNKDRAKGY